VAGAAGLAATVGLPGEARAETNKPGKGPRYGMAIDLRRCFGCHGCAVACKAEQDVPLGQFKSWVVTKETGQYPNTERKFIPTLCNHCENPPCVPVCPVDATHQRKDGVVTVTPKKCIGCKSCVRACPYKMRYMDPKTKKADKCDLCLHRIEQGILPACVNTCNAKARVFGDLNDPNSAVSKVLKANKADVVLPAKGTDPRVFYIGKLPKFTPVRGRTAIGQT